MAATKHAGPLATWQPIETLPGNPSRSPDNNRRVLGIDVGGANLKCALQGSTACCPFAMWTDYPHLGDRMRAMLPIPAKALDAVAVTMTGELADCFASRREGVNHILSQLRQVFLDEQLFVYTVEGQWLRPPQALASPYRVAASNWFALATWIGQQVLPSDAHVALIVDIGSTTVDVVPLRDGIVATTAKTDRQRLQRAQLLYTGYERTPVAAITKQVEVESRPCPMMAERFADSLDIYLVLGVVPEEPANRQTADGRGRTRSSARARLARMVGEDAETLSVTEIESIAMQLAHYQTAEIADAIRRNLPEQAPCSQRIVFCGHGHYLVQRVLSARRWPPERAIYLKNLLGESASRNAPALAVAELLQQNIASIR